MRDVLRQLSTAVRSLSRQPAIMLPAREAVERSFQGG